jgi:hypothetical protein
MNATTIGVNIKYVIPSLPQLSIVGGVNTAINSKSKLLREIINSRNVGQATAVYGSFFYVFNLGHKTKSTAKSAKTK